MGQILADCFLFLLVLLLLFIWVDGVIRHIATQIKQAKQMELDREETKRWREKELAKHRYNQYQRTTFIDEVGTVDQQKLQQYVERKNKKMKSNGITLEINSSDD